MFEVLMLIEAILLVSTCLIFSLWFDEEFSNRPADVSKESFKKDMKQTLEEAMERGGIVVVLISLLCYPYVWIYKKYRGT